MDAEVGPPVAPRLSRRARWTFDIGAVVVLCLLVSVSVARADRVALAIALSAALILPLLLRRRFPIAVFGVVSGAALVQLILGPRLFADLALLVALYTVAAMCRRRDSIAALVVIEIGCLLAVFRWAPHPGHLLGFVLLSGMSAAAVAIGLYTGTRRDFLLSLQERANRLERERDQQGALAAAGERERIAREMHDIVAHHLTVMVAVSDGAAAAAEQSPAAAKEAMRTVASVGREALRDTRRLLGVLRDDSQLPSPAGDLTPLPGLASLDDLVEQVRHTGLDVVLITEGEPVELPAGLPLTVYRLVQEALTNTMKHAAEPTQARVRIRHRPDSVVVEVSDDGLPTQTWEPGHGVTGMRERVLAWGGQLQTGPLTPQGWRVRATLLVDVPVVPVVVS